MSFSPDRLRARNAAPPPEPDDDPTRFPRGVVIGTALALVLWGAAACVAVKLYDALIPAPHAEAARR